MKIARVFPRKTNASPTDELAFFDQPGLFVPEGIGEVHVSVAFTYDMKRAEMLAKAWEYVAPVKMGGPAFCQPSGEFVPGKYLKHGYVITSRGCPNHCWFCSVPKREPRLIELPITEGWNVSDDNLLACSETHIRAVFAMLKRQKQRVEFTGGLEAKRLKPWHVEEFKKLRIREMFFAYDTPDDYEPLVEAGKALQLAGYKPLNHQMCCYVLTGYAHDTFAKAEKRLTDTMKAGFYPQSMLWRDCAKPDSDWVSFNREWANKVIVAAKMREIFKQEDA